MLPDIASPFDNFKLNATVADVGCSALYPELRDDTFEPTAVKLPFFNWVLVRLTVLLNVIG